MRTKLTAYYDSKRDRVKHGLMVWIPSRQLWARVAVGGKPILFDDQSKAEDARAMYRRMSPPRPPRGKAKPSNRKRKL